MGVNRGIENDIALIVLMKRLNFKELKGRVSPICFPELNEKIEIFGRNDAKTLG